MIVGEDELQPDTESPLLLEMLRHVTTWQEPVTRGKRTFDDHVFFTSLEEQYGRKKSLSPRQRYAMKRMVFRYKNQIPEFEKWAESCLSKSGKGKEKRAARAARAVSALRKHDRLVAGGEDRAFLEKRRAESRERGRPRPQQRALQKIDALTSFETKPRIGISISLSQSGRGRPRSRLRIHEPRTKLACPLSLTDYH